MRAKRICSSDSAFAKQKNEISKSLRARGYPEDLIAKGFIKVAGVRREELLSMVQGRRIRGFGGA